MKKNFKLIIVTSTLGLLMFSYQNCAKIKPSMLINDQGSSASAFDNGDAQAIVQDGNNNIIDVIQPQVNDAQPSTSSTVAVSHQIPVDQPIKVKDDNMSTQVEDLDKEEADHELMAGDEKEPSQEEIASSDCAELAKKYKNAIDIAKLPADAKLTVLKGKNFIYSSEGEKEISNVSIEKSCGRTILCGVKIKSMGKVNGRLDLIKDSDVKHFDYEPKNIKTDK